MKKIRIIATPPGQAPEWVRKEWVGLELPTISQPPAGIQMGVHGGSAENTGGYVVDGQTAVTLLGKKSPTAAQWWKSHAPHVLSMQLVFKKEVCELVQ